MLYTLAHLKRHKIKLQLHLFYLLYNFILINRIILSGIV